MNAMASGSVSAFLARTAASAALVLLAACSQAPGGNTGTPTVPGESGTPNVVPVANAGPDRNVTEGANASLDGSASSDSDGSVTGYQWTQTAGPAVTLSDVRSVSPSFTAPTLTSTRDLVFSLVVTDNRGGNSTPDSVTIHVQPVNVAPTAADDSASTPEDAPVTVDVLFNDRDADDSSQITDGAEIDPATLALGTPVNGTATLDAGHRVVFTPAANFSGAASVTYTVKDRHGASSNVATLRITVAAVNDAPTISDTPDQAVDEDQSTGAIAFGVADVDSPTLTVSAQSSDTTLVPASGIALAGSGANRTITVTPAADRNGAATITVTVRDGAGATASDTFVLTVRPVNDAPVAQSASTATDEDAPLSGTLSATDADLPADTLTYSADGTPSQGSVQIATGGGYTFTPAANYHGAASFGFKVCDAANACSTATVSITVNSVNDAPAAQDATATTPEDTQKTGKVAATDADGDAITFSATGTPAGGTVTVSSTGNYVFRPAANFNGAGSFQFQACDPSNACGTGTVTVNVTPVNDAPTASNSSAATGEDTALSGTLGAGDIDGDTLDYAVVTAPAHGTATVVAATGAYTYTPAANYSGGDSFVWKACDPSSACATATVSITVGALNDAPTLGAIADQSTGEDTPTGAIALHLADPDSDVSTLTLAAASGNATLLPPGAFAFAGTGADRTLTITPAADQSGSATVTVTVSDGSASSSRSFTLTVGAVNDAPTASAIGNQAVVEDGSIDVPFTVADADDAAATLTVVVKATDATLVPASGLTVDGSGASRTLHITPAPDRNGSTPITVTVRDPHDASGGSSFVLTVTAVNDVPAISDIGDQTIAEDSNTGDLPFTVADAETSASALTVSATSDDWILVPPGAITFGGSGQNRTVRVTPAANQSGGPVTVTVSVSDGTTTSSDQFSLTVTAVDDAPVAQDASFAVTEDTPFSGAVGATDVDSATLHFSAVTQPAHGTLTLADDGSFQYVPARNFAGADSFGFKASDGNSDSSVATATLNVGDVAEPAVSVSSAQVQENAAGAALVFTVSLSRVPDGEVTVSYTTADGTARAGADYGAATGTLTFDATTGASQTVSVPVTDDDFDENDETMQLVAAVTGGADSVSNAAASGTGTILDDAADAKTLLRIGAARRSIQPSPAQVAGINEPRVLDPSLLDDSAPTPITHKQFFNLGGFGVNPLSNMPDDPIGVNQQANTALTQPAGKDVFTNSQGRKEEIQVRVLAAEQPAPECTGDPSGQLPAQVTDCSGGIVVFVTIDAVGAGNLIQKGVKNAVIARAAAIGITLRPQNILFGQTHSHAGPDLQGLWGGVPQDWVRNTLYVRAADAVEEALKSRQPAHLSYRQGSTLEFNSYRRAHIDPKADADGHVTLLQATADDGTPVGNVLQYNAHPTGIGAGTRPRIAHPDFILGAVEWLENPATGPGGVSLYYNGPIADASGAGSRTGCAPVGADSPYSGVRCKGEGIADHLMHPQNVLSGRELPATIESRSVEVLLPVTNPGFLAFGLTGSFNRYYNFMDVATDQIPGIDPYLANLPQLTPVAKTTVSRVTLGGANGLEIVTIPGEATNTFGEYIRGLTRNDIMFLGLTHNSFGYIVPEDEFNYVDQTGGAGLVVPYTNYLETVSLGPLTAPLLRNEGYNRLFGVDPTTGDTHDVPPSLTACLADPASAGCLLRMIENRLDLLISQYLQPVVVAVAGGCHAVTNGTPLEALCGIVDGIVATGAPSVVDVQLLPEIVKTEVMGCDFLDTAHCLFPFPNDFFTVAAADGSPQSAEQGGTGRRVNLNPLGMPHNSAGKPVDPTEWNRNDGFSPGQMIVTYVPGLAANADGTIPGAVPITDVARSLDANAPIFVIDADTGERHLVWAETDLNANLLVHGSLPQVGGGFGEVERPLGDGRSALIIRPAKNFEEGHRYIVALRNLKGSNGAALEPGLGFKVCRGDVESTLRYVTPVRERCDHVAALMDTLAAAEGPSFKRNELYLTWDFTVASAKNDVGRLAHMRDDAFNSLATVPNTDCTQLTEANAAVCAPPTFKVDRVTENPQDGIVRRIEGTISVPSYVVPVEGTPLDNDGPRTAAGVVCSGIPQEDFTNGCQDVAQIGGSVALPPNRLFYSPADGTPTTDVSQAPYGDGLPDRVGTMQTAFMCQIPAKALVEPARASIYGHGLLDARTAVTYEGSPEFEREHNFMYCAVDLYGFATGDLGNVATTLVDVSNFPVVPDASQQGLLNYMFLARAIGHPNGFLADPAFRSAAGRPLFDRREVFYNGNSQGGIVGGAVMAISKDINRGVLGSLGMNYSTLLQRSKDFDPYSTVLYASYTEPLDRMFLFSMMQMLWDRSENNGYAEHLTRKSDVEGGPVDHVMLNSMFADQQVTAWSADVMARTMDIPVDYAMIGRSAHHHPDLVPGWPQAPVTYGTVETDAAGEAQYADVSSVLFEYNSREISDRVPIGNVPMREGDDPHDSSHRRIPGRCQLSHWMQRDGRLLNLNTDRFRPEDGNHAVDCPAVRDNSGAPGVAPVAPVSPAITDGATGFVGELLDAIVSGDFGQVAAVIGSYVDTLLGGLGGLGDTLAQLLGIEPSGGLWLRGDMHVHDDHSADGSGMRQTLGQGAPGNVSVADQVHFAESQGLDFLPLTDHRTFDQHYDPLWTSDRLVLITGEEANGSPHANVFGAVDMINQGDNPAGTPQFRRLQQSIWDAHAQGAAWQTNHPDDGEVESVNPDGSIVPNDYANATGPDLIEIWNRGTLNRPKIRYAESRWNAGWVTGIGGASDNHFKELWPIAGPGQPMTHVFAREKSTHALLEGIRAGRTAINLNDRAPFLTLAGDFDGDGEFETLAGDEHVLAPGEHATLRVAISNGVGAHVDVYREPGTAAGPYLSFTPTLAAQHFDFQITGDAAHPHDWYRVEARGPGEVDAAAYQSPGPGAVEDPTNSLRAIAAPIFTFTQTPAAPQSAQLPADAGADDGAVALFGSAADNAFAGFARVAESDGVLHAVAEVHSSGQSHVLYRRRDAGGALGASFDIAGSKFAAQPAIAAAGSDVWVVWQDERGGEMPHHPQIFLRHSTDGGATWSLEQQLSSTSGLAQRPDIALINPAMPVVVWQDNGGGAFDVMAMIVGRDSAPVNISSAGKTVTDGNGVDTRSAYHPASVSPKVAVRADGTVAIAWQDNRFDVDPGWTGHTVDPTNPDDLQASFADGEVHAAGTQTDDWEILAAVRNAATGIWSAPQNVSNATSQADRHAAVAFAADGSLHVAWDSKSNASMAGPRLEIRAARSTDAGANWTALGAVDRDPTTSAQRPVLARLGNGLSLFWMDGRSEDWRWRVRRADSGAGSWTGARFVTGPGNGTWPSYDNGFLAFTSDRSATREQRKPHQVFLLALDPPRPSTPNGADVTGGGEPGPATTLTGALDRFIGAVEVAIADLGGPDFLGTPDALIGGVQQLVADLLTIVTGTVGDATGLALAPPAQQADPDLPPAQPLMAGAAKRPVHVPVGTPLGGYLRPPVGGEYIGDDPVGELTDNVPSINDGCDPTAPESCIPNAPLPDELRKVTSPYATYSPPSRGYYDSLTVKAVALYDGHDYIVMIKTDMIGMLDEVVQDVKKEVLATKGIDLGDGLIMSGTHTHDGPGALANDSTRYFWLAMDAYQHDVYRKVIKDVAAVAIDALNDLHPARIGHATGFDHLHMHHYRRDRLASYQDNDAPGCNWVANDTCENENDADELRDRIGLLRVDDLATGEPIALVVNYAIHGIAFDVENQYFSGDVIGSLERETEQSFARAPGERAPITMMIQNTAGDVTPSGYYGIHGIEAFGKRMAPQVRAIADGITQFDTAPDLRTVSQRIVLNRERLGYKEDEYPYPWGAAQCGNDLAAPYAGVGVSNIPGYDQTGLPTKHPYCIFSPPPDANDLADNGVAENGAFLPQDTILKAARIGDVTLMVQPGEPLTEYGVRLLEMSQTLGYNPHDTFVWGYSGDHVGYILPPVEQDWASFGGAESTTTFWGWKQGARFIDVSRGLLAALRDGKAAPADEFQVDYSKYRAIYDATPAAVPTPSLQPGAVVEQPSNIKRFGKTQFVFEGGDPVLDFPNVLMEHADGTPVRRANGEPLDTFFEMHLKYRLVTGRHLWTVEFESTKDWPLGNYRFKVSGKANQGVDGVYGPVTSDTFAVTPATNLQVLNLACGAGGCDADLRYVPVPRNYRIVDALVSPNDAAPVRTGSATFSNGTSSVTVSVNGNGHAHADGIGGTVTVSAEDGFGNTTPPAAGPPADADGDGVPDGSDQCPDTPAGEPADANGCSASQAGTGFPVELCEPFAGYCLSDIPGVGAALQDALDTAWNAVSGLIGGGGAPSAGDGYTVEFAFDDVTPVPTQGNALLIPLDEDGIHVTTTAFARKGDGTWGRDANRSSALVVYYGDPGAPDKLNQTHTIASASLDANGEKQWTIRAQDLPAFGPGAQVMALALIEQSTFRSSAYALTRNALLQAGGENALPLSDAMDGAPNGAADFWTPLLFVAGGTPPPVQDPIDPALFDCAGPAGDPAPGTPEFAFRDAENVFCTQERHQDTMSQPANNPYMAQNYGADPYRNADRWANELHRGRHETLTINGAAADIYMPCTGDACTGMPAGLATYEPPYPIAIVMHGLASDKNHLQWASEPLAERGYFVVAINGTGSNIPTDVLAWLFDPLNPHKLAGDLDLSRIGTTGHSLGAENSTRVQGDPRVSGIVAWDPCDGSGGNECRDSKGSRLHDKANATTPTLFLTADYLGFPGYPQPQVSVPGDLRVEGFGILRGKGVDTMLVTPRATTHLDWAGAFTFGNRYNEATSLYYTLAWFDRYVKGKLVVDGAGSVVTAQGRTEAAERAYRQAIADAAFARLTATRFDSLVDLHNISQGRWDRLKALMSGDMEYGGNVPYRVTNMPLADRYSFYHRSVCYISRPDFTSGNGSQVLARADTTEAGDMRLTGCPVVQAPVDTDGDGVPDAQDAFPNDPAEWADADGDGNGDNADPDDDNDGVPDGADACPATPAGTQVGADGCPTPPEQGGFPIRFDELCDPMFGFGCMDQIPGADQLQGALDTAWSAVTGGGVPPAGDGYTVQFAFDDVTPVPANGNALLVPIDADGIQVTTTAYARGGDGAWGRDAGRATALVIYYGDPQAPQQLNQTKVVATANLDANGQHTWTLRAQDLPAFSAGAQVVALALIEQNLFRSSAYALTRNVAMQAAEAAGAPDDALNVADAADGAPDGSADFWTPLLFVATAQAPVTGAANASCGTGSNLSGNRSYQVKIPSASGQIISFQVLEPATFDCAHVASGAHPLILHGHGFGGSRSTTGFADYRSAGYAVISIDQRGHGGSSGTIRVMDPDYEGQDLVAVLDWAEANLDYLAYRDESLPGKPFVSRPAGGSTAGGVNLVAGAIGGSYGGGYQLLLHAVDAKERLDALAPDITWHDLRWSLNPNDVLKSAWDVLLTAGGEAGSYAPGVQQQDLPTDRGLDPYIKEVLARGIATGEFPRDALAWFNYHSPSYWCGLNDQPQRPYDVAQWDADPNTMLGGLAGDEPRGNTRSGQRPVDVLLSQGFRDTLFNVNDAWWNYQCLAARGGDVRLVTHQSGHLLSGYVPANPVVAFQAAGGSGNCGSINRGNATVQWFQQKLRGTAAGAAIAATDGALCVSLAEGDAVSIPPQSFIAPRDARAPTSIGGGNAATTFSAGVSNVPNGVLAQQLYLAGGEPAVAPLLEVTSGNGAILGGIPTATVHVTTPLGINDAGCQVGVVPTLRTGCDSVSFLGLGLKRTGQTRWELIDDQLTPVRGLGTHSIELVGVAERLQPGDQLGVLVYGYHPQYLASYSRDPSIPLVNVSVENLGLPLYRATGTARNAPADTVTPVGDAVRELTRYELPQTAPGVPAHCTDAGSNQVDPACFATGGAIHALRTICDYQWIPGVCDVTNTARPGYAVTAEPDAAADLFQVVGAVHNHSGYSDGDPSAIPADYYRAGRVGHNVSDDGLRDTGVKLDFMIGSEHSDNEKLAVTTAAVCVEGFAGAPGAAQSAFAQQTPVPFAQFTATTLVNFLSCANVDRTDHYFKWQATLEQAIEGTEHAGPGLQGAFTGFTAMRGFEYTNDYYNHLNVYFSSNVVNVKNDGSYLDLNRFWDWLARPVAEGGGADGLVTFNHPGGNPHLSPFDGGAPTGDLLQATRGGANWNDVAYVDAEADQRVFGMEVNGGDDIEFFVKGLANGWHLSPVANEDEHQREWATSNDGKTLVLVRGRSPQDYYWALKNRRTMAIHNPLVNGAPGTKAQVPLIQYWADGADLQGGAPLGSRLGVPGTHQLHVAIADLPMTVKVALVSNTTGGQSSPIQLGTSAGGSFGAVRTVTSPVSGEDWYFVVLCPVSAAVCGSDQNYVGVTAPIWLAGGTVPPPPPPVDATPVHGLAGCALTQDPALCTDALSSLPNLQDCSYDESGVNCAFQVAYDAVGVDTAAGFFHDLFAQCAASPAAPACDAIRSGGNGAAPDGIVVASRMIERGALTVTELPAATPSGKTVDGQIGDWMAQDTRIGGTALFEYGEHVYTDFLFDAFGADDGDDARRLAVLALGGDVSDRTGRVDALQQAGNDQLDVPPPAGTSGGDHYGDAVNRDDGTDLTEVRWAADSDDLFFLARVAKLQNPSNMIVVILADTDDAAAGMTGLGAGLRTTSFDHAIVLRNTGGRVINLASGASVTLAMAGGAAAVSADGYDNALEASIPRVLLERGDGKLKVAVFTAVDRGGVLVPANVAYRHAEPVTIYSERAQAMALFARTVDPFTETLAVGDLLAGRTQSTRPAPGYHERQFISGANISSEADTENGRLQPYGVFVPHSLAQNGLGQARMTIWTHYRGGKAHSGAAWTPRLFTQLGEEQGNIVVSPRARGTSTWYTTRAHQDFFEVFADVAGTGILGQYAAQNLPADSEATATGLFAIDPAHVAISGYSMGGFATYLFTGLYPDLFSAGFAQSGAVTQGAWTGIGPDGANCRAAAAYIPGVDETGNVCFIEANEGRANAQLNWRILDNTRHVPIEINHGTNDELALTPGAVRMGERLLELGYRYDAMTFIGYEHFTQAIMDEWRDGAHYVNRFARPANPRTVTYKVVPALVKAVNEVNPQGSTGTFNFHPDGAYWTDGLVVRSDADGSNPEAFGQLDAESEAIAENAYLTVPSSEPDFVTTDPYLSTPLYSPGNQTTPFVRHGQSWVDTSQPLPTANRFRATLTNLSAATLDVSRMGLSEVKPIEGTVISDGASRLTLANVPAAMTLCAGQNAPVNIAAGGSGTASLGSGTTSIVLLPGADQGCLGVTAFAATAAPAASDVCAALGIPSTDGLCLTARNTESALAAECLMQGGSTQFCTLTGGNLHALVDACYGNNPAEADLPACRIADAFVGGAAAYCRQVSSLSSGTQPPQVCAQIGGELIAERSLQDYEKSWTHQALLLQDRLGYGAPLVQGTVLATHNSFNATDANTPPTASGSDYNQLYGLTDQLRMDIRSIELDVHWMPGPDGAATNGREPMLCHGLDGSQANAGCTFEKPLRAGLQEIRAWLDAHPDETLLLYIEDDITGTQPASDATLAYDTTAGVILNVLEPLIYKPASAAACSEGSSASWLNITRKEMLDTGRRVILFTENCTTTAWSALFHQKNGGNWVQGTQRSYDGFGYGACQLPDDPSFIPGNRGSKWTRVWEDSTVVTASGAESLTGGSYSPGNTAAVTPAVTRELMRCGLNMPGFDRLTPTDGRLAAAVWSWAGSEPSDAGNCAATNREGRWFASDCGISRPHACVSLTDSNDWTVSASAPWSVDACGPGRKFAAPTNGYANEKLKAAAGGASVWLNYFRESGAAGGWTANDALVPAIAAPPAPPDESPLPDPADLVGALPPAEVPPGGLPSPGGWIGDPAIIAIDPTRQCGSLLGMEGCL